MFKLFKLKLFKYSNFQRNIIKIEMTRMNDSSVAYTKTCKSKYQNYTRDE